MAPLKVGDSFPEGVKFDWVPILDDDPTVCGRPQTYDANKEFKGKKVVIVSVPGAFTPTCQANHLPPYIEKINSLKEKGVDVVAFIAYNDAWVMNAWGKVNKVSGNDLLFLSDGKNAYGKEHGWLTPDGVRNSRWVQAFDKDGKCIYSDVEPGAGVTVSGVESVLAKL